MALTAEAYVVKSPDKLGSMNDIWGTTLALGLSTSNSNAISVGSTNFKYWTQMVVFDSNNEEINLGIFQYPPRPFDNSPFPTGYGAFSVANPLRTFLYSGLSNYTIRAGTISSNTLKPNLQTSLIKYEITSGFSYNPQLSVEAFEGVFGGNSYLGFSFSSNNYFSTSANIYIVSDNPYIQGTHIISGDGFTNSSFLTLTSFTASMSTATPLATITDYSQGDPLTYRDELYGFNSVMDYDLYEFSNNYLIVDNSLTVYPLTNTLWKFLSSFENRKQVFPTSTNRAEYFANAKKTRVDMNEITSFIMDDGLNQNITKVYYTGYSSTYSFVENVELSINPLGNGQPGRLLRIDIPTGYINLTGLFTNIDAVKYYTVRIGDDQEVNVWTELRTYVFDDECTIYNPQTFMFMNKLGGWDFWTFTLDTKETQSITKNEYKKEIPWGDFQTQPYGYRGQSILSGKVQQDFRANTNWISESEYNVLSELVRSPEVYVMVYRPSDDFYYPTPIIITDTSYEIKTAIRDQIFNLTINYKMAVDTPIQRK
jgi:hypothetical protein